MLQLLPSVVGWSRCNAHTSVLIMLTAKKLLLCRDMSIFCSYFAFFPFFFWRGGRDGGGRDGGGGVSAAILKVGQSNLGSTIKNNVC